jgi:hypothetical protein
MNKPFHEQRRQPFLTEEYFLSYSKYLDEECSYWKDGLQAVGDSESEQRMLARMTYSNFSYLLLSLRYTAGIPIEELRPELTVVIEAYEHYQKALSAHEGRPSISPLGLDQVGDYERAMQLIGLCYLLHRRDLLPRIASMIDPGYVGEDTLYEDLLAYALPGRVDLDEWYHDEPYTPLVHALYEADNDEAANKLDEYLKQWYPAFKYVPWHDGHLRIDGTDGDYFGYWAFEAGAVALLCNIDDSQIAHLIYPKDLVAWARENADRFPDGGEGDTPRSRSNVPAGNPCPEAGWWFTPAQANSRRYFKQGETMPSVGGDYGLTFWQWSPEQSAPKL